MNAILFVNNVHYHTIEVTDHRPEIYWAIPRFLRRRWRCYDIEDISYIIQFRHCGLGNYHYPTTGEEEYRIRSRENFEKYFSENLSTSITHPPDTEITKPADLYPVRYYTTGI